MTAQIRDVIRSRRLSAYQVGAMADVDPSVVSRFLAGERGLRSDSLDAICDALGLELRETRRGRSRASAGED